MGSKERGLFKNGRLINFLITRQDRGNDSSPIPKYLSRWAKQVVLLCIVSVIATIIIHSQPIALAQTPDTQSQDFFIEAKVDNLTPYLGQQVTYTLLRYQAIDFPNQPYYEDKPFSGFWDTPLLQRPPFTTTINGREYQVRPTHIALFPTIPGPITIDTARLIIPGDGPEADTVLESERIDLQVKPLPDGAPVGFAGAVGQFEISATTNKTETEIDQPITLIVEIKGTGNIPTLTSPTIPILDGWRLLGLRNSPNSVDIPLSKEVVKGTRRFEWPLVPIEAGQHYLPAINFSYFDPNNASYHSLRTDPIAVVVLPPAEDSLTFNSPSLTPNRQDVRRLANDIRHIKPVPAALETEALPSHLLLIAIGLAVPLLAIGGAWGWRWWQKRYLADTPQARRRRARHKARALLATAQHANADPYAVIREAIIGYLSDKFQQPVVGLTGNQLITLLAATNLSPELIERVETLLGRIDTTRFAPVSDDSASVRTLLAATRVLIDDVDYYLRDVHNSKNK